MNNETDKIAAALNAISNAIWFLAFAVMINGCYAAMG